MFKKMPSGLAALQIRDDMDKMNINHEVPPALLSSSSWFANKNTKKPIPSE